jgi:ribose 5-phosphate isomerase RpiB
MSKINKVSLGTALEEVSGYLPFNVSDEQKATMATEIYKAQLVTLGLREVAEAIRDSTLEENVWNNKNLVSFVFEVLERFHYSGIQVKKSDD